MPYKPDQTAVALMQGFGLATIIEALDQRLRSAADKLPPPPPEAVAKFAPELVPLQSELAAKQEELMTQFTAFRNNYVNDMQPLVDRANVALTEGLGRIRAMMDEADDQA